MLNFILIHGAAHGGWCWYKAKQKLEQKGHTVFTPDLPGHESGSTLSPQEITFESYVQKVLDVISGIDGEIVLVGHSMGGAVITKVIDIIHHSRIKKAIYVSGFIPQDGDVVGDLLSEDTGSKLKSCFEWSQNKMAALLLSDKLGEVVYNGCKDEDIEYAKSRVVAQSVIPLGTPIRLHNTNTIERIGIVCTLDKSLTPGMQEKMYKKAGCAINYLDSGHAPFFSRADELVEMFVG